MELLQVALHTADPEVVLGRYRLGARLGAGGFGAVHEAVDELLERRVAVKVIPAEGSASDRARREARAAARLDHPGIVALFDAGEAPGARYLVSELVEGPTLAALEADGTLTDRDVLRIGLALCDALHHAHERGVVHRDVKPQNVLVPDRPGSWRAAAKLTDFGVAMLAGDDPLTLTGDVVGTLAYMAPEQASGGRVDHRADIYALGLVLYEALAGHNPVRAGSPAATARRVGTVLPSLGRARRDLPPALCEAVDRAVTPDAGARGTLDDLADALEDALVSIADEGGTIVPHPLERGPLVPRGLRRVAAALAAGALAFGALAGLPPEPVAAAWPLAAAAAAAVALLPRGGWVLTAAAVPALLVLGAAPAPGAALLVALAVAPVPLLLRGTPLLWSVPALAPGLGVAALAGAYPALAALAARWPQRAALGAAGAWWLLLGEALAGRRLHAGVPEGLPAPEEFRGALYLTMGEVVGPLLTSGLAVLVAVWAVAAAVLPWVVRGAWMPARVVAASVWAGTLAAATATVCEAFGNGPPRGLVAGALLAGAAAVAADREYFGHDEPEHAPPS